MNKTILAIKGLYAWYKTYAGYAKVLNGVDFSVCQGERVGLVGESGCGKTTLMKTLLQTAGTYVPGGEILFEDIDMINATESAIRDVRRKKIAMISQEPMAALNPVFSIGKQMTDVITNYYRGSEKIRKSQAWEIAREAIDKVMIPDAERILSSYPHQLSGGMRQRVCIATALSTPRDLIIADEPGTALDVTIQAQIHKLLRKLTDSRETSLIMITHSLGVARELTDRIYVMYAGNIVEHASVKELFSNPLHPYTKGLLDCVPRLAGGGLSEGIYGYVPDYINPVKGCRFSNRCKYKTERCEKENPLRYTIGDTHDVACYLYENVKNDVGKEDINVR